MNIIVKSIDYYQNVAKSYERLVNLSNRDESNVVEIEKSFQFKNLYPFSFPPVTIKPSLTVVNMVKTGPEWTCFTIRDRL